MACEPNRARLLCMLSMTFGFFIVEVVVSRMTSSLSMLSDSFHMLSDVIALVVALVAVRFAEKTEATNKNTFGWIRAEVMGALVNAVFLTALCFTIVLEAVERFTEPQEIEGPLVVVGVGAAGLLVNLLGLCLFHGHAGGGHGHSHGGGGGGGHSHGGKRPQDGEVETNHLMNHNSPGEAHWDRRNELVCKDNTEVQVNGSPPYEDLVAGPDLPQLNMHFEDMDMTPDSSQLNMRGVFLHVLGDALGSVIVVITATIFYFVWTPCGDDKNCVNPCINGHSSDHRHINHTIVDLLEGPLAVRMSGPCWVLYLDPVLCIIMVGILLYTTYPLLKESALILLQTVPKQINMDRLNERLLRLDGVLAIHELHIWQLAGSRIIATAHIKCHDPTSYMEVAKRIKDFFHNEGIHATTIQPEFVTFNSENRDSQCELACRTVCAPKLCCGKSDGKKNSVDSKTVSPNVLEVISETQESVQMGPRGEERREAESTL
ncbi:zinc transporter 1a [Eucyclogobius newberryi]|uniref:zinc transporter 1a n=1 Tax=Eucyclogobius newberryi TaxID=166745 RepID=UPI003B58E82E